MGIAETKSSPEASLSVIVIVVAASGPEFFTETVNVTLSPTVGVVVLAVLVSDKSTDPVDCTISRPVSVPSLVAANSLPPPRSGKSKDVGQPLIVESFVQRKRNESPTEGV